MITKEEFNLIANLITKKIKVKCIPSSNIGWSACIEKKEIYYPDYIFYSDEDLGYLIHEAGHLNFSDGLSDLLITNSEKFNEWILKTKKAGEQVFLLLNSLEDIRIEALMIKKYPGTKKYLKKCSKASWMKITEMARTNKMFHFDKFISSSKKDWLHYCMYFLWKESFGQKRGEEYLNLVYATKRCRNAIAETNKFLFKDIRKIKSFKDLCLYASNNIFSIYIPLCDDNTNRKTKKENQDQIKKIKNLFKKLIKLIEMSQKERKKNSKKNFAQNIVKINPGEIRNDIKKTKERERKLSNPPDQHKINSIFDKESIKIGKDFCEIAKELIREYLPKTRKAISILKDLNLNRFEGNYESGKLQNRKLYKLKTGQTKIFTRKISHEQNGKDFVFSLLIDESGSMTGGYYSNGESRAHQAFYSAAILAKTLEKADKKFSIYGFNESYYVHKNFNEKINLRKLEDIYKNAENNHSGGNNDGYAIHKTKYDILKRPEKNKILFVLSDGKPNPLDNYTSYSLKEEILKAEDLGIKVYGIGIQSNCVEKYYKNHLVIEEVSQLPEKLLKIFKTTIGKRVR